MWQPSIKVERNGIGRVEEEVDFGVEEKWFWSWFEVSDSLERLLGTPTGKWVARIQWIRGCDCDRLVRGLV